MFEATANEFRFVQDLPKRQKSKLQSWWDEYAEYLELNRQECGLVTVTHAARALSVSRSRIDQLVEAGILRRFEFSGVTVISVSSIKERLQSERHNGRPKKVE